MFKTILVSIVFAAGLSACSTTYQDSALASDGGRFVVGSSQNNAAIYYCSADDGCEQIDVEIN